MALRPRVLAAHLALVACASPTTPPSARSSTVRDSPPSLAPSADAAVADAPSDAGGETDAAEVAVVAACAPGEQRFGTTCCRTTLHGPIGLTQCHGPNVGASCRSKGECDLFCSCDDLAKTPPRPSSAPRGPADGTKGVVGRCLGQMFRGSGRATPHTS